MQARHARVRQAGQGDQHLGQRLAARRHAQDVQAAPDLRAAQFAQVPVDVLEQVRDVRAVHLAERDGHAVLGELVVPFVDVVAVVAAQQGAQVGAQVAALHEVPDLPLQQRQLGRVKEFELVVLVDQRGQFGQRAVGVCAGQGGRQVVEDGGVRAPFGLRALARIVDDEGVEQRQVAQQAVREARGAQADALAGQPFQRAVLADMHERVRAEPPGGGGLAQPAVQRVVVVGGRQVRRVVDGVRVHAVPARGLQRHEHLPEVQPRQRQRVAAQVRLSGRVAPLLAHAALLRVRQVREPRGVPLAGHQDRAFQLRGGQQGGVVRGAVQQRVHQFVGGGGQGAHVVPVVPQGAQHAQQRRGRVEAHGVPHLRRLRRGVGEHERHAFLAVRDVPQPREPHGDARHALGAFRVRDQPGRRLARAVTDAFLEGEGHADQPPVEFRQGHVHGGVQRVQAARTGRPGTARPAGREALHDRHAQPREGAHGLPGRRDRSSLNLGHGETQGADHGVHARPVLAAQQRQGVRVAAFVGVAQAGREDRQGVRPGVVERRDERIDEARVAAQGVRAVQQDAHCRAARGGRAAPAFPLGQRLRGVQAFREVRVVHAVQRQRLRGLRAVRGQAQRIRDAQQQFPQVRPAARGEVRAGGVQHRQRREAQGREFRVGFVRAADQQQPLPARPGVREQPRRAGHRLEAPVNAHQHDLRLPDRA